MQGILHNFIAAPMIQFFFEHSLDQIILGFF